MMLEVQSWPYDFPASEDFPTADERGLVSGRLMVKDRHVVQTLLLMRQKLSLWEYVNTAFKIS